MAQIEINDLSFFYDGSYDMIFDHVSFRFDTDWKLGLTGRNGRGKTTLCRLLLGELPYQGEISLGNIIFSKNLSQKECEKQAGEPKFHRHQQGKIAQHHSIRYQHAEKIQR